MTKTEANDGIILKTDVRGRVHVTRERREALLAQFDQSGMSGSDFAKWVGMKYGTLATWLQKRRQKKEEPARGTAERAELGKPVVQWVEAVVAGGPAAAASPLPSSPHSCSAAMVVHGLGGIRLELHHEDHAGWAAKLLRQLGGAGSC